MRMDDRETVLPEEPPATVGARLRVAREAAGLGREDVSAQTKIAERHLLSIEEDRFSDLAGRTYAVGFSRAYARALGLDEGEIAEAVRTQLDSDEQAEPRAQLATFEPGDPARVPPARLAWPVAIGGVLTVVALLYLFWPSFLWPQGSLPDLVQDEGKLQPAAIATDTARQQVTAGGAVVFTATAPRVWVKFTDAEGNQLFQKEMGEGERYGLPADAEGPLLWTARPDALEITVGGKSVARLSDKPVTMKDVPVSGEALLARSAAVTRGPAAPASRETISRPPRAASEPGARPVPSVRPRRVASPRAASNGPNGAATPSPAPTAAEAAAAPSPAPAASAAAVAPSPAPAASEAAPASPATVSPAPAPVATPGADPAPEPASESVSTDSTPASTVSD